MQLKKTKTWLLSAVMAAGIAGFGSTAFAAPKDQDERVKIGDVPRDARRTIEEQAGRREIRSVDHVIRDGREFYRVTIDDKGNENTVLRVAPGGKVLGRDEVADTDEVEVRLANVPEKAKEVIDRERGNRDLKGVYKVERDGRTFYRAIINEKNGDRMIRVSESGRILGDEDIREIRTASGRYEADRGGGVKRDAGADGERIAFDRLPGEVKTALGKEAGADRVTNVTQYQRRGQTMYRAEITSGDRTRVVRVNENGRIVSEVDDTDDGRQDVKFKDLPGDVKSAIGKEINADAVDRVTQITRDGRTTYRATDKNGKTVVVDDNGKVLRER